MTEEKDCTEQYFDCDAEPDHQLRSCAFNQECKDECVTDLKHCDMHSDEGEIISELLTLTALLKGEMTRLTTSNSMGRTSKKIVIEYDVKTNT